MTISLQSGQQSPKDYSQLCCHGGWAAGGREEGTQCTGVQTGLVQPRAVYIIPPPTPPPTRILLPFPFCTEGGSPHLLAAATARENGLRRVYLECVCFHICSEADRGTYKCAALGKWNTPPSGETLRLKYIAVWWNCPLWGEWNTPPSGETLRLKYIAVWWNCPLWGEWNTPPSGETLRFKYIAVWWNCPLWGWMKCYWRNRAYSCRDTRTLSLRLHHGRWQQVPQEANTARVSLYTTGLLSSFNHHSGHGLLSFATLRRLG